MKKPMINLVLFLIAFVFSAQGTQASEVPSDVKARLQEAYGNLPLSFEANQGQTDRQVQFLSRGPGYTLFLAPSEAVLALKQAQREGEDPSLITRHASPRYEETVLRMRLLNANPKPKMVGSDEQPGKVNYFIGKDPAKWRTHIPTYAKVTSHAVYPGVDLVYYGHQRQLEFDFVVAPGADPNAIRLQFEGPDRLEVDAQGNLVLHVASGAIRLPQPLVYQTANGARHAVSGRYVLTGPHQVSFLVAAYDTSQPLVIDPTLVYSTYLGGSGTDFGLGIAVDAAGSAYVTGATSSTNFPTASPLQAANGGGFDAFVSKLNAAGSGLVYSTYLGGSSSDQGIGIAVDAAGSAYVTGLTGSSNFPTASPLQAAFGGGFADAFVSKLDAAGSGLVYSTYLGGSGGDGGSGIAVDAAGSAYVTGQTDSPNFPTANPLQAANGGGDDAFVSKLNSTGSALLYSTYLGGSGGDFGLGIAVDAAGSAYVTGRTDSSNFPTASPLQAANGGGDDAFVSKLDTAGSALLYSTYLGGSGGDFGHGIVVDAAGSAYVTGRTDSPNFPTASPLQAVNGGGPADAFVSKLDAAGSALLYSTYLGGSGFDQGLGIAVDAAGSAYVAGFTDSPNFPTASPLQAANGGGGDAFVAKIAQVTLPSISVGKVTGVGTINVTGGIANFGFIVQSQSSTGPITGDLQFVNHATGDKMHSVSFTAFTISGNTATFGGTCTNNGVVCTFTVNVTDNGEPGTTDSFTISISGGAPQGGTLRSGNIQIHD